MSAPIEGNQCAMVTPFLEDGDLDLGSLDRLVDYLIDNNVDGIIAVGTTGEAFSLEIDERKVVAEATVQRAQNRVPIGVMVGYAATAASIDLARHAEAIGADYLLLPPPPSSFPLSGEGLATYYVDVAHAVTLPVMVYDGGGGVEIPLTAWRSMVAGASNILYAKVAVQEPRKVAAIVTELAGHVIPLAGKEEPLLLMLGNGARGTVSATANVVPTAVSELCACYLRGDKEAARQCFYSDVLPIMNVAFASRNEFIQSIKQLLAWKGVLTAPATRKPLPQLDGVRLDELSHVARSAGVFAEASAAEPTYDGGW